MTSRFPECVPCPDSDPGPTPTLLTPTSYIYPEGLRPEHRSLVENDVAQDWLRRAQAHQATSPKPFPITFQRSGKNYIALRYKPFPSLVHVNGCWASYDFNRHGGFLALLQLAGLLLTEGPRLTPHRRSPWATP